MKACCDGPAIVNDGKMIACCEQETDKSWRVYYRKKIRGREREGSADQLEETVK